MNKPIQIKYSCPESLENMPKSNCGFYCDACKKEIYDFRGKTLAEVKEIQDREKVSCGVFDHTLAENTTKSRIQTIFRIAFAAVFILGFNVNTLIAQTQIHYPVETVVAEKPAKSVVIKGTVVDNRKKPIETKITVYLNGETQYIETDEKGAFEFEVLKSEFIDDRTYYMLFSATGMENEYVYINEEETQEKDVLVYSIKLDKYKAKNHRHDYLGFF